MSHSVTLSQILTLLYLSDDNLKPFVPHVKVILEHHYIDYYNN
jgi:hypothetical protein